MKNFLENQHRNSEFAEKDIRRNMLFVIVAILHN